MINHSRWMLALGMAVVTGFVATHALAQTDAQRNAIKSACRSDYMSKCSSVPPGGAAAFQCLQKNMAGLSSSCQTAVKALEPVAEPKPAAEAKPAAPPPAAAKPPVAAEVPRTADAPKAAVETPKAAAQPVAPAAPVQASTTPEPAKPPASAAAAAPAAKPSDAQVAAIRGACSGDYRKVCSSVPPGGAAALQCLEQNKAKVSATCAKAIASASGAGGSTAAASTSAVAAAPATSPAAAPAAAPAAPAMVLRPLRPLEELRIVRAACGADARAFCSGIEPGGGRVAQCLAANAGSLSPACNGMLAQFAANR
ncbi:hypothetical protein ACQR1I_06430 [Bradyrhizobium sp. HKCCYLS2038]|uniref:hypothetical protein n=1 Tax=unclassified Bradyrhizobium TaxID=2631580 RepID=UPI003EBFAE3C